MKLNRNLHTNKIQENSSDDLSFSGGCHTSENELIFEQMDSERERGGSVTLSNLSDYFTDSGAVTTLNICLN